MKILLISKIFYPSNRIGAVRPSNFAKYLTLLGHDVTVVTEDTKSQETFCPDGIKIKRFTNSPFISSLIKKNDLRAQKNLQATILNSSNKNFSDGLLIRIRSRIKVNLRKFIAELFHLIIEYDWYIIASKALVKSYGRNSFDIVISSYGPFSSFLLGIYCFEHKLSNKWICDLRDNIRSESYTKVLNFLCARLEYVAIKKADALIFVSNGQREMFFRNNKVFHNKEKYHVIFNGFEKDLYFDLQNQNIDVNKLNIAYTGQLYKGKSDFKMLFDVLSELVLEGLINPQKVHIHYAGQSSIEFEKQLELYHILSNIVTNYGFVSKSKAKELQLSSDILIVLAWNTSKEQGILSGKFLEYIQLNKPIISLTTGNLANAELSEMIFKMNLGIACEYINLSEDKVKLRDYLLIQYQRKISFEKLNNESDQTAIAEFDYENLTKKMSIIMESLTSA